MTLPINTIICGDCLDILKDFPDNCVDLVLTDPPYGINRDKWDNSTDRLSQYQYNEIDRISEKQIIFGGNYFTDILPPKNSWIIWDKTIRGKQFLVNRSQFEMIWTSLDIQPYIFNYTLDGNIQGWNGGRPDYKKQKAYHSAQKPVEMICFLIEQYSDIDDLIVDCFIGSGSVCVAAKMLGRRYIGIDISPEYCKIAEERLREAETGVPVKEARAGQGALFE